MKWKEVFPNPDLVGSSEYLAIYEMLTGLLGDERGFNPNSELTDDELETITAALGEFRAWTDKLQKACGTDASRKVVIHVSGGVATAVDWPANVVVEIRDYDTEGSDPEKLEADGSVVAVYAKEPGD